MKLADVTRVDVLSEGHVEPNALLSLERVAATGRFTNKFEEFVLAKFSVLIKDGLFWDEPNPVFTGNAFVSTAMLASLRMLQPHELQAFASRILKAAQEKNETEQYYAPAMTCTDWMYLYTAHEATD